MLQIKEAPNEGVDMEPMLPIEIAVQKMFETFCSWSERTLGLGCFTLAHISASLALLGISAIVLPHFFGILYFALAAQIILSSYIEFGIRRRVYAAWKGGIDNPFLHALRDQLFPLTLTALILFVFLNIVLFGVLTDTPLARRLLGSGTPLWCACFVWFICCNHPRCDATR